MNTTTKTILTLAFVLATVLLLLFGGGAMTGVTPSGGMMQNGTMMGNGVMGGIDWMWIPALFMLSFIALLVWAIFGQKK